MNGIKRNVENLFADGEWHRAGKIAEALGVTRQTAHRYLRRLVEEDRLIVAGAGRGTRYRRRPEGCTRRYETAGLEDHQVWIDLSGPDSILGSLTDAAQTILNFALTEMVNNVVDHSGSPAVVVEVSREGSTVELVVADKGAGIFEHIRSRLNLGSELEALQELSKGKVTTMPERHTGEGIFFTSKAVDEFEITSGSLKWIVDNRKDDMAVGKLDPPLVGTTIRLELDTGGVRDLADVFDEYTTEFQFDRTRTVIRLFAISTKFISRSEAKRLLQGLEKFREVVLDFKGTDLVGQGFADEVFRVWTRTHPETRLFPMNMCDPVEFMVERAIRRAEADEGNRPLGVPPPGNTQN
jgi:anti-sigma regulatory factor (Ser/Thr protein kinase)